MKILDIIIPTYNRKNELQSMLASLIAQTKDNWRVNIIVDDTRKEYIWRQELTTLITPYGNIKITYTNQRYNDWGHTPREIGKQDSDADYILMTGDDNYYVPTFIENISPEMEKNVDFIYWDMVHSHYGYSYFKCEPRTHAIDMGAFCIKRELAQQLKLGTNFAADGDYVEAFKKKFPNATMKKINKILFVHN
jgi:glycosyltransferase involved in cell wall biosynthesis